MRINIRAFHIKTNKVNIVSLFCFHKITRNSLWKYIQYILEILMYIWVLRFHCSWVYFMLCLFMLITLYISCTHAASHCCILLTIKAPCPNTCMSLIRFCWRRCDFQEYFSMCIFKLFLLASLPWNKNSLATNNRYPHLFQKSMWEWTQTIKDILQ